tara:strand:- start:5831 stop:7225 length:1395 start_codon:yes stop_codon:yes gene_type:complete
MPHVFDPVILREYDIRGQIGKNLSEKDAYALGRAFATYISNDLPDQENHTICVGYDGRHSSPLLVDHLIKGLLASGINVKSIGLGPSPMLYYAVKALDADAGIMITGSHNPPDYNGFKMTTREHPVFGDAIQEIGRLATLDDSILRNGVGHTKFIEIEEYYVERLLQDLKCSRPLKIAWDAGNGAAGDVLKLLTSKMPGEHILLYEDIDGTFPNHHPDPTVDENLKDLQKVVREQSCDLGIAFDGDADRIGVVDEHGDVIRCDTLMVIYARDILARHPGAPIIGDVKCSAVMYDEIAKMGGQPVMWKTGHSVIKDKMREMNAPLAGELSGHIFFGDGYYGYDDALYCAIRLINALEGVEGGLSSLTASLPKLHNTPEIRLPVEEREKFDLIPRIIENTKNMPDLRMDNLDGIRVTTADGWWLARPSNTQNVLVIRAESATEQGLESLLKMVGEEIGKLGYTLPR